MLYSEKVMDHFKNPRNVGEMPDADGIGEVGNAKCGDIMRMYIKVKNGIITDVKFMTFGCGSAIATSSMATELIKGKPIEKALEITNQAVVEALDGLPAYKLHCSVLAEEAIKAAIKDYFEKHHIKYDEKKYAKGNCACLIEHEHAQEQKAKADAKKSAKKVLSKSASKTTTKKSTIKVATKTQTKPTKSASKSTKTTTAKQTTKPTKTNVAKVAAKSASAKTKNTKIFCKNNKNR